MPQNPNCTACSLHASSKHVCIWGSGGSEGFVVGEAPGRAEGRSGKVFQGQAGQYLRPILAEHGIDDPYITNAAKCRPPENRKPEPDELRACKPYLLEEIEEQKPKAILLLGAIAMRQMIGRTGITEMNGQVVQKDGQTFVCCFHPAYILRDPSKEGAFRMAVGRYAQVLKGTFAQTMPEWRAIDRTTFDEFVNDWTLSTQVSFDVETAGKGEKEGGGDGLEWWHDGHVITSISFSLLLPDGSEANWGCPIDHPAAVLKSEFAQMFIEELTRSTGGKRVIAQNGKFDNLCLMKRFGVKFYLDGDAMLAHHLIDENSAHGLKGLARQYCGAPDYDLAMKEKKDTRLVPFRRLLSYNAADAAYTRRLEPMFTKKMSIEERWLYDKVIMPSARIFEKSERNGLYVNIDLMNRVSRETKMKRLALEKKMNKMAGKVINWNAPAQVAELLYGKFKLTPTVLTDKGAPSTGEAALVDLDHPIGPMLEEYRGYDKFESTYVGRHEDGVYTGGWRDFMIGPHLYLGTKLHGTVTGRYSSRLHQVPRDGTVRNVVIAPEGWTFVQLDLSQAELRIIAIISKDPEMLDCFKTGKDIHWRTLMAAVEAGGGEYVDAIWKTAKLLTKRKGLEFPDAMELVRNLTPDDAIELWDGWKEGRKKAKGINFGFAYGQSAGGFIDYAKAKYGFEPTLLESTTFRNAYFDLYRALPAWHDRQKELARMDGFVRNMSGRKRRLPGIYSKDRSVVAECERQAINAPVQGFIGDYKAMIVVELDESLPPEQYIFVGEVHDSILSWVKTEHLNSVLPRMKKMAEHPRLARECGLKFPIEMTVDIETGPWGAGKRWKS